MKETQNVYFHPWEFGLIGRFSPDYSFDRREDGFCGRPTEECSETSFEKKYSSRTSITGESLKDLEAELHVLSVAFNKAIEEGDVEKQEEYWKKYQEARNRGADLPSLMPEEK